MTEALRESSDDQNDEEKVLSDKISELRSAKKELLEKTRPFNEELERIAQRERQCVDRLHRLATEKHDREKYQQMVQRLVELEAELRRVKCENGMYDQRVRTLSDKIHKLKHSLDQATKYSRVQRQQNAVLESRVAVAEQELDLAKSAVQARSEIADNSTVRELQKQWSKTYKLLDKTKQELSETRQRLCEVQERLTVAEQVTAATQQRAVLESDNSDELLLLELSPQLHSATHAGFLLITYFAFMMPMLLQLDNSF